MHILAVLYCYPPLLVPASICYLKLVLGLSKHGVDVDIVTIVPETFDGFREDLRDRGLGALSPSGVVDFAVRSPESSPIVKLLKGANRRTGLLQGIFEPKKREWTFAALRRLRSLDWDKYDCLLTCSQPHANHVLGLRLKRRSRLPWIAYFSDPWTDNPYATYRTKRVADYNRSLEDEVLRQADVVLYTSEEMRRLVATKHPILSPEKVGVLPHSFVPEWYDQTTDSDGAAWGSGIRLLHTGHFYGPRTPMPFLNALSDVRKRRTIDGKLSVASYGTMPAQFQDFIDNTGLAGVVHVESTIPYLRTLSLMRKSDYLLLIDAKLTETAESVFLPSKLVDYLGSSTPIIAITPENGASARVVRETGGIVCSIENQAGIERLLTELIDTGRLPATPRTDAIMNYEYTRVTKTLVDRMLALCRS